jgi:Transposase and inactivated derivatives
MTKKSKTLIRYSTCFKLQVVEDIEKRGLTIESCRMKYGIRGTSTIQQWLLKYGKAHLLNKVLRVETRGEKDELKRLQSEIKSLKQAYAELSLEHKCSEKVIELSDELFGTDLKKKYALELSKYSVKKKA